MGHGMVANRTGFSYRKIPDSEDFEVLGHSSLAGWQRQSNQNFRLGKELLPMACVSQILLSGQFPSRDTLHGQECLCHTILIGGIKTIDWTCHSTAAILSAMGECVVDLLHEIGSRM